MRQPLLLVALAVGAAMFVQAQITTAQALAAFADLQTAGGADPDRTTQVLNELKAHLSEIPDAYLRAGDHYFRASDPAQAILQYREGIAADAQHKIDYLKRIIDVLIRQTKTGEARQLNLEILSDQPDDLEARALEASFRLDKGETDAALMELQKALVERPQDFVAQFNLGSAWFKKGNLERAGEHFLEAVKLEPNYKPAQLALTQLALRRGDPDTALQYARQILQTNPHDQVAAVLEAAALVRKGRYDESRAILSDILQASPNQADTLLELGVLNIIQKRYTEAEAPFRKAYELDPSNLRGLLGIAEIRFQQNQPEEAVKIIAREAGKHPQSAALKEELATAEVRAGRLSPATVDFEAALALSQSSNEQADIHSRFASLYDRLGGAGKATKHLEEAARLQPSNAAYLSSLAQHWDKAGKPQEAIGLYRSVLRLDPNNGVAMNNLAYLLSQNEDSLDEALQLALSAKKSQPNMPEVSDTLGWIYVKQKASQNAIEIFRDVTHRVPSNPTFHHHYAVALDQTGDHEAALRELKAALQHDPNPKERKEINDLIHHLFEAYQVR